MELLWFELKVNNIADGRAALLVLSIYNGNNKPQKQTANNI